MTANTDMARVLAAGGVHALYQPIVNALDGSVLGYEALARMTGTPHRNPDEWLAHAELLGCREDLELACLRAAAAPGRPPNRAALFVNVGPAVLANPRALELRSTLPDLLVLELTEREAVEDYAALREHLAVCRSRGVRLAIDDTGSGWSTLRHVVQLRPDFIKLDRSLIVDVDRDRSRRALVCALVAFARESGSVVIAEGVERHDELNALVDADVTYVQGFLLARPALPWCTPSDPRTAHRRTAPQRLVGVRDGVRERLARTTDPPGAGVTGRTYLVGETVQIEDVTTHPAYLEAIPGVVAEICVPLRVEGCVAGSLNVESFITLSPEVVREVESCAELLGVRLAELGATARESAQQRLVRHAARFAEGADRHAIEHAVLAAALDVSDLDSAALVLDGPAGLAVVDAIGPLAPVLRHIDAADLVGLGRLVEQVASCYTAGDSTDAGFVGTEGLRAAGARTVVVVPLMAHGRRCGMLLVADMTTATFQTGDAELLELLASHAGTCLANADLLEMLRDRARRDPLTGLSNHSAFHELLDLLVQQQCGGTLLLADIDRFKAVNDQEGHPTGDELLRGVAHALQAVLRTEDDLFRIGGDEFAAILRQLEPAAGEAVAARLTDAASAVLRAHGAALSVGIAHLRPGELATELVERADRALYQAKREGCGVRLAEG